MKIKSFGRLICFLVAAIFLSGCMSAAKQSRAFFSETSSIKLQNRIAMTDVPFIQQDVAECGPATLAMAFQFYHQPISVETISQKILRLKKNRGTLPSDMIMTARANGFMALQITGLEALLREVAAGHPVIVFENLGISWWSQWHYAIIVGYDLENKTLLMHSGPERFKVENIYEFELSWRSSDYWALVVTPPGSLSATGSHIEQISAAVSLENLGFFNEAELSYQAILNRWPDSYVSLLGLGQMAYRKNKIKLAVDYFKKAVEINPKSDVAQTNLKIAFKQLQKKN